MVNYLVTGARAPVALELARNLSKHGNSVYLADSLKFPLAKQTKYIKKYFNIASPRLSIEQYIANLNEILIDENIDILIPTCEEIFYLSAIKPQLNDQTLIFCPDFVLIKDLHSKIAIYSKLKTTNFLSPKTLKISKKELLSFNHFKNKVVKKEYCRFGNDVFIEPDVAMLRKKLKNDKANHFIVQDKIAGVEYCTYAISVNGNVNAIIIYKPAYRIKNSASIYFQPVRDSGIDLAVRQFCKQNQITGQIGFDLIKNDQGIYLIDCNPRATSGLHLLSNINLSDVFTHSIQIERNNLEQIKPKMITSLMIFFGFPAVLNKFKLKQWKKDFKSADDVLFDKSDRPLFLYSLLSFAELLIISLVNKVSVRRASTYDIEWDGEKIDP